jgi:hypothetical protein
MIRNGIVWRWGWRIVLAAMLLYCGVGCQPAGTGSAVPTTSKPNKQPDKDQPGKQPKPDVGRSNPLRDSPVRALRTISPRLLAA